MIPAETEGLPEIHQVFTGSNTSIEYSPDLPITEKRALITAAIQEHQVLVVTGETGSGKSTQLPKMCLEAGRGIKGVIGCTQPRRIAAVTLAARVAQELSSFHPGLVGYKIRFQDRTAPGTRIKFMTDGILLAEAQRDRLFRSYDTLIIDEAHERTLNIDFILGLLKKILPRRPELKVLIASATLDPERFSKAFGNAPIIEVSGRTYPVDVWYQPFEVSEDEDDLGYIDQAVAAVDLIKSDRSHGGAGDILVFMPTETDIRETVQRLEDKRYFNTIVLPLFGRMAAGDQQRIFQQTREEKIIVATNVAETSITIPRIKYVVDTGLARISQYNPRSRTQSLPVAPISQASAEQRKGRCGRVEAGICIRLFSREDFLSRPLYTAPEIQRSNLAEVILRMLFLRLGDIQDFPFLDPPSPSAIKDAFGILRELGAVDDHRRLTPLGRMMAKFPLDPRLSRMLVEARRLGALNELVILVAALSIPDPRERPFEQEKKADAIHALFQDRRSDFVTLLKIWHAFHQTPLHNLHRGEIDSQCSTPTPAISPSRSRMRRFCRDHYLSYRRMREWQDIHAEIWEILDEFEGFVANTTPAGYEAVHRALLSGYLSHIARKKEKNLYIGSKDRQVMLFPGSGLFNRGGDWIMSAELVQTSRLFARTAAVIEPEWIEELGSHLCRRVYSEPHWEKNRGQVVAYERVVLYGLTVVERRKVNYGRIKPEEAHEIFIRDGLVQRELPGKNPFLDHNRKLIERLEEWENRTRRRDLLVNEESIFRFYHERLPGICDAASMNKLIKDRGGDDFLRMTEADLVESLPDLDFRERFPDRLCFGDVELPLKYAFQPGSEQDGVTVTIPVHLLCAIGPEPFQWLVPGLIEEKILFLLKALPKTFRRHMVPIGATAQTIARSLPFGRGELFGELCRFISEWKGVQLNPGCWQSQTLPAHLQMRFEIIAPDGHLLGSGRNLEELRSLAGSAHEDRLWQEARLKWEKTGLTSWDFGDLPEKIPIGKDVLGVMRHAYIGLAAEGGSVAIRLFGSAEEAMKSTQSGLMLLYQLTFETELRQFAKSWVFPGDFATKIFFVGKLQEANRALQGYLLRELFQIHGPLWPNRELFLKTSQQVKGRIGTLAQEMIEEVKKVVIEREVVRSSVKRFQKLAVNNRSVLERMEVMSGELEKMVPPDFLDRFRRERIKALPRHLKGLGIRIERAYAAPEKDRSKSEELSSVLKRYEDIKQGLPPELSPAILALLEETHEILEEYKISVFAPEMKTLLKVSPKRVEEKFRQLLQHMETES